MIREPVHGKARLLLVITMEDGPVFYTLSRIDADRRVAHPAWRVTKESGEFYDVHCDGKVESCTCPDFVWAREHKDRLG